MWQVSESAINYSACDVSPVKQNWIVIYHCSFLWQVLVWQWLVSSALYPLWHCGMVMASLCPLMVWCEIPDVQQRKDVRLVRTLVRNEKASLRRPLSDEVVGIWRSGSFVVTSVHQNEALFKKEQETHSSTRLDRSFSHSTKTTQSNWKKISCSENRYLLKWTFLRLSLVCTFTVYKCII